MCRSCPEFALTFQFNEKQIVIFNYCREKLKTRLSYILTGMLHMLCILKQLVFISFYYLLTLLLTRFAGMNKTFSRTSAGRKETGDTDWNKPSSATRPFSFSTKAWWTCENSKYYSCKLYLFSSLGFLCNLYTQETHPCLHFYLLFCQ